jgi:hypothetical protein
MNLKTDEHKKYIEVVCSQRPKRTGDVCGDYVLVDRTPEATTCIVADGIGSGIKAHVAAVMCASRLMELIRLGFTPREACKKIVDTMHEARTKDIPFSAFSICRVLNSGHAAILSYEIPSPVLVNNRMAAYMPNQRSFPLGLEIVCEVNCMLDYGDGVVMVSDGVSQAGLGREWRMGWGIENACDFINGCLIQGAPLREIPEKVMGKIGKISGASLGDDTTCVLLFCKEASTLNILTGPPASKKMDKEVVANFMAMKGLKVVCGSTTVEMVGRNLGVPVRMKEISESYHKPPSYEIEGIDYATEGALTLNQVYNILDEDEGRLEPDSSVSDLYRLLRGADRINFVVGTAKNVGHETIFFRQMGVYPREVIVKLLAEKLKKMGKLLNIDYIQ